MDRRNAVAAIPLIVVLAAGLGLARTSSASALGCAVDPVVGLVSAGSRIAEGEDPVAVVGSQLVTVGASGEREAYVHGVTPGTNLRHVTTSAGRGTAFVHDQRGPDTVVIVRPDAVSYHHAGGEVSHPAWSPDGRLVWAVDLEALELWEHPGSVLRIPGPPGTEGVFSPVFVGHDEVVAVVAEPVEDLDPHDAALDNLWRLDLKTEQWARLTQFEADEDRWSVVRTPLAEPDGAVAFVRITGMASATEAPSFELWRLTGGVPAKVHDLPGEMFLAAITGAGPLWNVDVDGEWRLFLETDEGLEDRGCGAILVDPRGDLDPDMQDDEELHISEPGQELEVHAVDGLLVDAELAVLVGDFATVMEAQAIAARIQEAGPVEIVDHDAAPWAVAPGAVAAAVRLPLEADPETALTTFRKRFPDLAERMWIVSLGGGTT